MRPDIIKRIDRQSLTRRGLCYICGKRYQSDDCPHGYADQEAAVKALRIQRMLGDTE